MKKAYKTMKKKSEKTMKEKNAKNPKNAKNYEETTFFFFEKIFKNCENFLKTMKKKG